MPSTPDTANSLFATLHEDIAYKLEITDVEASLLRVASYRGNEALSELFRYTITVATDSEPESIASLEEALGRDATFTIECDGKIAYVVHGIITAVEPDGAFVGKTQARVVFVLEPRLANLRYSGGFRIFQDMAAHEIINAICEPENIERSWHVHGVPAKREYCTQFNESDLDFVARIASEEGMHYFFVHDDKKTTMVFANEPKGYPEIEKKIEIAFNETVGAADSEHVRSIGRAQSIRTGAFEHRDFDFLEPNRTLAARAVMQGKETTGNSHKREVRGYPGGFIDKDGVGKKRAQMRLEELRSEALVFSGAARSLRFSAGHSFTLAGHREDGFNRKLLLTSITTCGAVQRAVGGGFRGANELTTFTAVPAETPIHPKRKAKPRSRLQSARVVGPADGDPYVDEHGRVKVQFFWDRDGKFDAKSSCWVRMMAPVAHMNEGFWQAHKVGSEVMVGFLDDDIDRPMILGALYNAAQTPVYPLPEQVAKSVWRTNSIPGNKGFNEITQDNAAGKERIFLHAQRALQETVGHNHTTNVAASQSNAVGAHQSVSVGAARDVTVGANETTKIKKHRKETVDSGEDVMVTGHREHIVKGGNEHLTVTSANRTVDVSAGNHTTNVKPGLTTLESQNWTGHATEKISLTGDKEVFVEQGDTTLKLESENVTLDVAGETKVSHAGTTARIENSGKVTITASPALAIRCAGAELAMGGGNVALSAPTEITLAVGASGIKISEQSVETTATVISSMGLLNEVAGGEVKFN
ncbi:type VI secretion system Vgr family protein [Pendulispora albinea]|uniref:Type VI secretion system tip protein VgrG n=1 Tax=Pendulispora albinea TaxID=2741071 RepID=A0ABZ2LRW7_9BACT